MNILCLCLFWDNICMILKEQRARRLAQHIYCTILKFCYFKSTHNLLGFPIC